MRIYKLICEMKAVYTLNTKLKFHVSMITNMKHETIYKFTFNIYNKSNKPVHSPSLGLG